ncbi:hypothetical protein B0H16DRAFT_1731664 [Mycena metata]|uniref:Uncharacterized protein n=1 Tax=Mycena metata TaxID=1033252 RepID=A0AAD7I3X4_9AGAR|nr:hypothetical protein B0H16DRAFT_1731664 [Mycena metata]
MASTVYQWHDIRTLVLMSLSKGGPTQKNLKDFCRVFKETYNYRITMGGTKDELAYRIVDRMTEYKAKGDTEAWEAAYESWMDVKFALFPNSKRDE